MAVELFGREEHSEECHLTTGMLATPNHGEAASNKARSTNSLCKRCVTVSLSGQDTHGPSPLRACFDALSMNQ